MAKKVKVFRIPTKGVIPVVSKKKKIKGPKVKTDKGWKV